MAKIQFLGWPANGPVSQVFGVNPENYPGLRGHNGLDVAVPVGTEVYLNINGLTDGGTASTARGRCVHAGLMEGAEALGKFVIVHVDDPRIWEHGYLLLYAHLLDYNVVPGVGVALGWQVGVSAGSPEFKQPGERSTGAHLHFGLAPCYRPVAWNDIPGPGEGRVTDRDRVVWTGPAPEINWRQALDRTNGYLGWVDPLPFVKPAMPFLEAARPKSPGPDLDPAPVAPAQPRPPVAIPSKAQRHEPQYQQEAKGVRQNARKFAPRWGIAGIILLILQFATGTANCLPLPPEQRPACVLGVVERSMIGFMVPGAMPAPVAPAEPVGFTPFPLPAPAAEPAMPNIARGSVLGCSGSGWILRDAPNGQRVDAMNDGQNIILGKRDGDWFEVLAFPGGHVRGYVHASALGPEFDCGS